jgi:hypothetical protein
VSKTPSPFSSTAMNVLATYCSAIDTTERHSWDPAGAHLVSAAEVVHSNM